VKIGDVMNKRAVRIENTATLKDAARVVSETQASDLMVVDASGKFVGVLSEGDIIRAALPNYDDLMRDGTSLGGAWKIFLEKGKELRDTGIDKLVIRNPITFKPDEELLKAASTMVNKQIRVLPVVDDGKLAGTISRGDICHAVLG
jgi:CBS domain-containing protein